MGSALNPRQLARVLSFPSDTMHLHPDFGTLRDKVFDEVKDESFTSRFLRLALVEKFRSWCELTGLLALTHGLHTILVRNRLATPLIPHHDDFDTTANAIQFKPILSPVGAVPVPLPARGGGARARLPNRGLPCGFTGTCGSWRFLCRTVSRPGFCNVTHATALIPSDHILFNPRAPAAANSTGWRIYTVSCVDKAGRAARYFSCRQTSPLSDLLAGSTGRGARTPSAPLSHLSTACLESWSTHFCLLQALRRTG